MTLYFQCRLRRGDAETVSWIEQRGAKVGNRVELKTADGKLWDVVKVYNYVMTEEQLRLKQVNDRNALPSLVRR